MSKRGWMGRGSRRVSTTPLHGSHPNSSQTPSSASISPLNLDPQFDEIINTLSDEVAKLGPVEARSSSEHAPWWSPAFQEPPARRLRRQIQWGIRTSSAITVVGVMGCLCSIPELSLGLIPFSFPLLIISLFCCMLGGSCWSMAMIARRVLASPIHGPRERTAAHQSRVITSGEVRGWLAWSETICSLLGLSILAWVGYDYLMASGEASNYAGMIRRGLAGFSLLALPCSCNSSKCSERVF